ncbi:hypothetical protein HNY73_007813 [Argiope bruennichi]|uniref:Uncharacterized protein n=1 Tax=Argiope bruennichi TaxID=94029 RepID=A0A8T0FG26_ARGBR|nr:hypothetical protein HNY73_007813 [Argiope bruennichi]
MGDIKPSPLETPWELAPSSEMLQGANQRNTSKNACEVCKGENNQKAFRKRLLDDAVDAEQDTAQTKTKKSPPFFVTPRADFKSCINLCSVFDGAGAACVCVKPRKDERRRKRGAGSRTSPFKGQSGTGQSSSSCSSSDEEMDLIDGTKDQSQQPKVDDARPSTPVNSPRPISPSSIKVSEEFIYQHYMGIIQAISTRNTMGSWAQALRCYKEESEEYVKMRAEVARVSAVLNELLIKLGIPLFKLPPTIKEVNKICDKFRDANATSENKNSTTKMDNQVTNDKKLNGNQTPKRKIDVVKINQNEVKLNKKRTADEDGFIAPAAHLVRKVKNLKLNENSEIKIQKQPEGIEEVALDDEVDAEQAPAQPKRRRVPPFFVTPRADFKVMLNICRLEAPSLKSSMSSKFLKLTVETDEEHRRLLEAQGAEFNTFMLKTDRSIKVVIRGLPSCTPIEEIKEELEREGFTAVSITQLSKFQTKSPMPCILCANRKRHYW